MYDRAIDMVAEYRRDPGQWLGSAWMHIADAGTHISLTRVLLTPFANTGEMESQHYDYCATILDGPYKGEEVSIICFTKYVRGVGGLFTGTGIDEHCLVESPK